jgi:hypothetical protein
MKDTIVRKVKDVPLKDPLLVEGCQALAMWASWWQSTCSS